MASSPPASPLSPDSRPTSQADSTRDLMSASPTLVEEATTATSWTEEQELRLTYCQDQLKQAQKKWSDRQELWIREVDHLLEQKRAHAKALKKRRARAGKARRKSVKLWRPLSRTQSVGVEAGVGTGDEGEVEEEEEREAEEGEGEGDEGEEGGRRVERRESMGLKELKLTIPSLCLSFSTAVPIVLLIAYISNPTNTNIVDEPEPFQENHQTHE